MTLNSHLYLNSKKANDIRLESPCGVFCMEGCVMFWNSIIVYD